MQYIYKNGRGDRGESWGLTPLPTLSGLLAISSLRIRTHMKVN